MSTGLRIVVRPFAGPRVLLRITECRRLAAVIELAALFLTNVRRRLLERRERRHGDEHALAGDTLIDRLRKVCGDERRVGD